jgi:hypothetical protein
MLQYIDSTSTVDLDDRIAATASDQPDSKIDEERLAKAEAALDSAALAVHAAAQSQDGPGSAAAPLPLSPAATCGFLCSGSVAEQALYACREGTGADAATNAVAERLIACLLAAAAELLNMAAYPGRGALGEAAAAASYAYRAASLAEKRSPPMGHALLLLARAQVACDDLPAAIATAAATLSDRAGGGGDPQLLSEAGALCNKLEAARRARLVQKKAGPVALDGVDELVAQGRAVVLRKGLIKYVADAALKGIAEALELGGKELVGLQQQQLSLGACMAPAGWAALQRSSAVKPGTLGKLAEVDRLVTPRCPLPPGFGAEGEGEGHGHGVSPEHRKLLVGLECRLTSRHAAAAAGGERLRLASWNLRLTRAEHGVRVSGKGSKLNASRGKLRRVEALLLADGCSACALQECPGLGVDASLAALHECIELLPGGGSQAAAAAAAAGDGGGGPHAPPHEQRWASAWTLTHSEAAVFIFDPRVFQPVPLGDAGKACGLALEDKAAPGTMRGGGVSVAIQSESEWRQEWPELSKACQLRRRADEALALAEAAEAEEAGLPAPPSRRPAPVHEAAAASSSGWFKRPPAIILLRCVASDGPAWGQVVGLVSVHLKATDLAVTRAEASRLPVVTGPVEAAVAAAGGGAVLVVGDFNLAPPLDPSTKCAAAGAFDGLVASGYLPLLANEQGNLATNADRLVTAATGPRCYDNAWFKQVPPTAATGGGGGGAAATGEGRAGLAAAAPCDILLERAFGCLADGLNAGRQAAVAAVAAGLLQIQEGAGIDAGAEAGGGGGAGEGGRARGAEAVLAAEAAAVAEGFFAGPSAESGLQGILGSKFNEVAFQEFSDHKALGISLFPSAAEPEPEPE